MKKHLSVYFLFVLLLQTAMQAYAQQRMQRSWADSVYDVLTPDQRIAQLFILRAWSYKDSTYTDSLAKVIKTYSPGGICFFKGTPKKQVHLTNRLQDSACIPMLVTMDAEWGPGMRLDSAFSFPRQMALGAIRDDSLLFDMGKEVARQCLRLGVTMNLAPVADVNNNPKNPVIGFRSFGENPGMVARKSILYMKGMQAGGIVAVGKHFPGHGDTDADSHLDLPLISHDRKRLDSVELFPFKALIDNNIKGIMIAHLYLPAIDTAANTATTLSYPTVTGLLKQQLGFHGYVITDALDMKGVTKYFKPGEIEVKAFEAGNDILLLPADLAAAVAGIKQAVDSGRIDPEILEARCRRVLALKEELGIIRKNPIDTTNLYADLNPAKAEKLNRELVYRSIILLNNQLQMVPLTGLEKRKIALMTIGDTIPGIFEKTVSRYSSIPEFAVRKNFPLILADSVLQQLSKVDVVILAIKGITSNVADSFGITPAMTRLAGNIIATNRTIVVHFGTPYALNRIAPIDKAEAVLVAFQDNDATQLASAEVLFGGIGTSGRLPVTTNAFPYGSGETIPKTGLSFVMPEEVGIPAAALYSIDSIANEGIKQRAYPGCQVLLAKDGRIFYEKAFGTPRYEDTTAVGLDNIYDIASVTKIAATTLAIMKLSDDGLVNVEKTLGDYLPWLKGSNKAGLRIIDVMTHQAGLQEWIPFYKETLLNGKPDPAIYQSMPSSMFPFRVAEGLYIRNDYRDTLFRQIILSPLKPAREYRYSDLGFYLLALVTEQLSGLPLDEYVNTHFYKPLGLTIMGFNPRDRFNIQRIMPTEYDMLFRQQPLRGDVHDPGAAMLGGVAGHAGLFSNAFDLAVIMQMLVQDGTYGGREYLRPATVRMFTEAPFAVNGNRRGIGFDKPPLHFQPEGPVCTSASPGSFGHSGFTGTYTWADPENGLVYVFLSNRVYPDAGNQSLSRMNIRTNIHQAAYDLLKKFQVK